MTTTSSVAAQVNPAAPPGSSKSSSTVDYESFLKLLIAQLKNQDPTKPMDSTQFVSQLASFSAVEQQVATNARLDQLLTASNLSQAGAIVGLHVRSDDGTIEGNIKEVRIQSHAVTAVLEDGRTIDVGSGVTLSKP
jgi:flagellar basal-body rod modification protein FlgD